jgi:hypothetical protein
MVRLAGKNWTFCFVGLVFVIGYALIDCDMWMYRGRKPCVKHMTFCADVGCLSRSSGEIARSKWKTLHSRRPLKLALFPLSRKRSATIDTTPKRSYIVSLGFKPWKVQNSLSMFNHMCSFFLLHRLYQFVYAHMMPSLPRVNWFQCFTNLRMPMVIMSSCR